MCFECRSGFKDKKVQENFLARSGKHSHYGSTMPIFIHNQTWPPCTLTSQKIQSICTMKAGLNFKMPFKTKHCETWLLYHYVTIFTSNPRHSVTGLLASWWADELFHQNPISPDCPDNKNQTLLVYWWLTTAPAWNSPSQWLGFTFPRKSRGTRTRNPAYHV